MTKVFIVVKDETDYDGDREYPKVFTDQESAQVYCDWEKQKVQDWVDCMRDIGENVGNWVPDFYIEESELIDGIS